MLEGLHNNDSLSNLHIDLSSNDMRLVGAMVLRDHLPDVKCLTSLDISDNGMCYVIDCDDISCHYTIYI